ncbi:MAG: helix-turn-helix domain-containing protein [Spirochaetaceae bacterium]|jgi:transcriptional regulator with XRE-family HTH domain|nr:helix-turn-helix domain-containing protein [Spirochaetaceae bacterium]
MNTYTIDDLKILFGDNLRRIRLEAKISQLKLGMKIGLTHNFINDIERGKKGASFETIAKLSTALEVEPYRFFIPKRARYEEDFTAYPEHVEALLTAVEGFKKHYGQENG